VGLSLHHKSQILKCHYSVVPGSLHLELPDLTDLWKGKGGLKINLRMDLQIENPTAYDVEIEKNHLEVVHGDTPIASTSITPLRVPAGGRATPHIELPIELNARALEKGRALLDRALWRATLYLQVTDTYELPIQLLR